MDDYITDVGMPEAAYGYMKSVSIELLDIVAKQAGGIENLDTEMCVAIPLAARQIVEREVPHVLWFRLYLHTWESMRASIDVAADLTVLESFSQKELAYVAQQVEQVAEQSRQIVTSRQMRQAITWYVQYTRRVQILALTVLCAVYTRARYSTARTSSTEAARHRQKDDAGGDDPDEDAEPDLPPWRWSISNIRRLILPMGGEAR